MKYLTLAIVLSGLLVLTAPAEQERTADNREELVALIKEVQAQQAQLAANQKKLESKLAEVAETVRVARIFASRGR